MVTNMDLLTVLKHVCSINGNTSLKCNKNAEVIFILYYGGGWPRKHGTCKKRKHKSKQTIHDPIRQINDPVEKGKKSWTRVTI